MPVSSSVQYPIGLLSEHDNVARFPERREEIINYAVRARRVELVQLRETHRLLSWHPLRTAKIALISGLLIGVLAFLIAQIGALGRWYAALTATHITVSIPLMGNRVIPLGSYFTATSSLAWAAHIPVYGLQESVALALGVAALFLLEKLLLFVFRRRDAEEMRRREVELEQEIAELMTWHIGPPVDQGA